MRFNDTPELASWRTTVKGFVEQNWKTEGEEGGEGAAMAGPTDPERVRRDDAKAQAWLDKLGVPIEILGDKSGTTWSALQN